MVSGEITEKQNKMWKLGVLGIEDYNYDVWNDMQHDQSVLEAFPEFQYIEIVQEKVLGFSFEVAKKYVDVAVGDVERQRLDEQLVTALEILRKQGCQVITSDCGLFFPFQLQEKHLYLGPPDHFKNNIFLSGVCEAPGIRGSLIVTSAGCQLNSMMDWLSKQAGVDVSDVVILPCDQVEEFNEHLEKEEAVESEAVDKILQIVIDKILEHQTDPSKDNISQVILECTMLMKHHGRICECLKRNFPEGLPVHTALDHVLSKFRSMNGRCLFSPDFAGDEKGYIAPPPSLDLVYSRPSPDVADSKLVVEGPAVPSSKFSDLDLRGGSVKADVPAARPESSVDENISMPNFANGPACPRILTDSQNQTSIHEKARKNLAETLERRTRAIERKQKDMENLLPHVETVSRAIETMLPTVFATVSNEMRMNVAQSVLNFSKAQNKMVRTLSSSTTNLEQLIAIMAKIGESVSAAACSGRRWNKALIRPHLVNLGSVLQRLQIDDENFRKVDDEGKEDWVEKLRIRLTATDGQLNRLDEEIRNMQVELEALLQKKSAKQGQVDIASTEVVNLGQKAADACVAFQTAKCALDKLESEVAEAEQHRDAKLQSLHQMEGVYDQKILAVKTEFEESLERHTKAHRNLSQSLNDDYLETKMELDSAMMKAVGMTSCEGCHFILVGDRSRSMGGARWNGLVDAMEGVLRCASDGDHVASIVCFDHESQQFLASQQIPRILLAEMQVFRETFAPRGATLFCGALQDVRRLADATFSDKQIVVLFLTDGEARDGDDAIRVAAEMHKVHRERLKFFTFGLDCPSQGDAFLQRLAAAGNGNRTSMSSSGTTVDFNVKTDVSTIVSAFRKAAELSVNQVMEMQRMAKEHHDSTISLIDANRTDELDQVRADMEDGLQVNLDNKKFALEALQREVAACEKVVADVRSSRSYKQAEVQSKETALNKANAELQTAESQSRNAQASAESVKDEDAAIEAMRANLLEKRQRYEEAWKQWDNTDTVKTEEDRALAHRMFSVYGSLQDRRRSTNGAVIDAFKAVHDLIKNFKADLEQTVMPQYTKLDLVKVILHFHRSKIMPELGTSPDQIQNSLAIIVRSVAEGLGYSVDDSKKAASLIASGLRMRHFVADLPGDSEDDFNAAAEIKKTKDFCWSQLSQRLSQLPDAPRDLEAFQAVVSKLEASIMEMERKVLLASTAREKRELGDVIKDLKKDRDDAAKAVRDESKTYVWIKNIVDNVVDQFDDIISEQLIEFEYEQVQKQVNDVDEIINSMVRPFCDLSSSVCTRPRAAVTVPSRDDVKRLLDNIHTFQEKTTLDIQYVHAIEK